MSELESKIRLIFDKSPKDLYDLMEGESIHCIHPIQNKPKDRKEIRIMNSAIRHVWFVGEFGTKKKEVRVGNKFYVAHPEDFESWLSIGCPGVDLELINAYLAES